MSFGLERFVKDLRGALPYPSDDATRRALESVTASVRRPRRFPRRAASVAAVLVAASAGSFFAGRLTVPGNAHGAIPSAAAFVPFGGAAAARPIAVHCRVQTVYLKWDAGGRVQLLEYVWRIDLGRPVPTGRVVAYADNAARTVNPACTTATPIVPRTRDYDTANWDPHRHLELYCGEDVSATGFLIQIRPILNRAKQQIGNRVLVQDWRHRKAAPLLDARAEGRSSSIAARVQRCFKPVWPK